MKLIQAAIVINLLGGQLLYHETTKQYKSTTIAVFYK